MSHAIIVAGNMNKADLYILDVIENEIDHLSTLSSGRTMLKDDYLKEDEIDLFSFKQKLNHHNYVHNVMSCLKMIRTDFPLANLIIIAAPDFLGALRKCLIKNRIPIHRSFVKNEEYLSSTKVKAEFKELYH